MKSITKICAAAAVSTFVMTGGAFAAQSSCGAMPALPDFPADISAVSSSDMDAFVESYDKYEETFIKFNECTTKEFNEAQEKFKAAMDAYASKGKKR